MKQRFLWLWLFWAGASLSSGETNLPYHSPLDLAFSPNGHWIAVSDPTAHALCLIEALPGRVVRTCAGLASPMGVGWDRDNRTVFVAEYDTDTVARVNVENGRVLRRYPAGPRPYGLALASRRQRLLVCDSAVNTVTVLDLRQKHPAVRIPVARMPRYVAITPDESTAVAGNFLPAGRAADPQVASAISLIDLLRLTCVTNLALPPGSTMVRQLAVSPDGRWAFAAHALGRFNVPLTQLDRGWMNGNAISIIDLTKKQLYTTFLLDQYAQGAPDPWGLCLAPGGRTLWVSLSGARQVAEVNLAGLLARLAGRIEPDAGSRTGPSTVWEEMRRNPEKRLALADDLDALPRAGLISRFPVNGHGPRGIAVSPDGRTLAVAVSYSGKVILTDTTTKKARVEIALGSEREPDEARRGERIFHDATFAFQQWLSCATCHPDGRVDGLNWDLLNDGIGNAKNTRSLLWSHQTPPVMSLGIRANMEIAVASGFRVSQFCQPAPDELDAVRAYLRSLQPERSPFLLPNGEMSEKAKRGKVIFESPRTHCAACHPAPLFTDLRLHNVGTHRAPEPPANFDTPTLVEVWRTAPYLHHGAAVTLQEVLTTFNAHQLHGKTAHLTDEEINALVEYLLSL